MTSFTIVDGVYAANDVQIRVTDVAGNVSAVASIAAGFGIDTGAPSALTLTLPADIGSDTSDDITSNNTVTIGNLESGASWEYDLGDGNGFQTGSGTTFTLPDGTYALGDIVVRQTDAAGNQSPTTTSASAVTVETVAPTVTITSSVPSLQGGETATITFTFSEAVADFDNSDITLGGGTLSTVSTSDSGTTWTATFTPATDSTANGTVAVGAAYIDIAGNAGTAGSLATSISIDTDAPDALTLTLPADNGASTSDDITSNNTVTIGNLESGATWEYDLGDGNGFQTGTGTTFTLPDGTYALGDIVVRQTDSNGNVSPTTASTDPVTVDTVAPSALTLTLPADVGSDTSDDITSNNTVTIGNLESGATWEYDLGDGNGFQTGTGTTFSLPDGTYALGDIVVRQSDAAGNVSATTASTDPVTVDTVSPTVAITSSVTSLKAGETATITFTFSEAVSDFDNSDVTLGGGTLGTVVTSDGGTTWTATFTPATDSTANGTVAVGTAYIDVAGNAGTAGSLATAITIDTEAPDQTVTIASISVDSAAADFITNDNDGLTVNLTLSAALGTGETLEWSTDNVTFVSTGISGSGTAYSIDGSSITSTQTVYVRIADAAGNTGTVANQLITIDATAPTQTVTIASIDANDGNGQTDFATDDNDGIAVNLSLDSALGAGEVLEWSTDGVTFVSSGITNTSGNDYQIDASSFTASGTVHVRITDTAGNSSTVVTQAITIGGAVPVSVTEGDYDTMTTSGALGGTATAATTNGTYGVFTINADGTFTYVLTKTDTITGLDDGETLMDTITVATSNGNVDIEVTINGVESEVAFSSGHTGEVTEGDKHDTAMATGGTVVFKDLDTNDSATGVTINAGSYSNGWGTVNVAAAGATWTYSLDQDKIQHLKTNENFVDEIYVTLSDGSEHAIEVTVKGQNEVIDDPLMFDTTVHASGYLWHLDNIGRHSFNGDDVWDRATGIEVAMGVIDDGVQSNHEDLADNYDDSKELPGFDAFDTAVDTDASNGLTSDQSTHGTSAAGVIAAVGQNGTGVIGVSFNVDLTGFNFLDVTGNSTQIPADSGEVLDAWDLFDVVNNSWGTSIGFLDNRSYYVAKASNASDEGRDISGTKLGTVIVKSAGNDNPNGNAFQDALNNQKQSITVGAIQAQTGNIFIGDDAVIDGVSSYSNKGFNLLVSAPSNGASFFAIHTTDRTGDEGYNWTGGLDPIHGGGFEPFDDAYTSTFGGTSSSGPVVAGISALILDANPNLGWRDVKDILAYSAELVGSAVGQTATYETFGWETNTATNWNGGGLHISGDYGYGNVGAHSAVALAETWLLPGTAAKHSLNEETFTLTDSTVQAIDASAGATESVTYTLNATALQEINIEHIMLDVDWASGDLASDFKIELIDPNGHTYIVMDPSKNVVNGYVFDTTTTASGKFVAEIETANSSFIGVNGVSEWSYGIEALRGVNSYQGTVANGQWQVKITDTNFFDAQRTTDANAYGAADDTSTINSVGLTFTGSEVTDDDTYYYTEEFLVMAAHPTLAGSGRNTISDSSGTDTVNAAAISVDMVLDGTPGSSNTISDGNGNSASLNIAAGTTIENFISGSGNDTIIGNAVDNKIWGRYGNDIIDGGLGADTIDGGYGNDTLTGGAGSDVFVFGNEAGSDTITDFVIGADKIDISDTNIKAEELYDNLSLVGGDAVYTDGEITITLTGITTLVGLTSDFILV